MLDHEEPVGSLSVYAQWRVNAAAREAGVVVLLDGQGADELFGGYAYRGGVGNWLPADPAAALRELRAGGPDAGRQPFWLSDPSCCPVGCAAPTAATRRPRTPGASSRVTRRWESPRRPRLGLAREPDPLRRELMREAFVTSLPQLLRYADRSGVATEP